MTFVDVSPAEHSSSTVLLLQFTGLFVQKSGARNQVQWRGYDRTKSGQL